MKDEIDLPHLPECLLNLPLETLHDIQSHTYHAIKADRQWRWEPVQGERFARAWVNLDALPGGMMVGPEGRFGPIPASTSCWITTSEREVERLRAKGPVLEVWLAPQPSAPAQEPSDDLMDALRNQRQIDRDGTEVGVSRQALDEAIALLARYGQHHAAPKFGAEQ